MANFPIINANLYITKITAAFAAVLSLLKAGFDILTGIITEKIMDSIKQDKLIGTFVSIEEASQEVGKSATPIK